MGQWEAYRRDLSVISIINEMMSRGMPGNREYLLHLAEEFQLEMDSISEMVSSMAGVDYVNLASPDQVSHLLFHALGLDPAGLKQNLKGYSTDEDSLNLLLYDHPVVPMIMRFRELGKLRGTYATGLADLLVGSEDHRIHTSLRTTRTATGRLSSADPNLQNIPVRSEDGRKIRRGFEFPADSGLVFLSGDLSQIELRVLAHESRDEAMMEVYRNNGDIHSATAMEMFRIPIEAVDDLRHRYPAKRVNFGIPYGITGHGLREQFVNEGITDFTEEDCDRFIEAWFRKYPGAKDYIDSTRAFAIKHGYVEDIFGRRRLVPEVYSAMPRIKEEGLRKAQNHPIQCLPFSTRIRTTEGYQRIGEFEAGLVSTGESWSFAQRLNKSDGEIVKINIDDGATFLCDTSHYLLTSIGPWPEWVNVLSLKPGDVLVEPTAPAQDCGKEVEDKEFWYWVGRYYGDGTFSHYRKKRTGGLTDCRYFVSWAFGGKKVQQDVGRCVQFLECGGFKPRVYPQKKKNPKHNDVIKIVSHAFDKKMMEYGIEPNQIATTKRLADVIFTLDSQRRMAVFQGYYDADGTTRKKYSKGVAPRQITSVNRGLLQDTQLLLRSVGIKSKIYGPYGTNAKAYQGRNNHPFYRLKVPDGGIERRRVLSVEKTGKWEKVFTLSVDDERHAFDSEGVVSKNSAAAGIIKEAMRKIYPKLLEWRGEGIEIHALLQIHDSLEFEVPEWAVGYVYPEIKKVMETSVELSIPILADFKSGRNWGEMRKLE